MFTRAQVELPRGTAGFIIGAKGANIKKIKSECTLDTCRVVNGSKFDYVQLEGPRDQVELAEALISNLLAQRVSDRSRQVGYAPTFSCIFVQMPISNEADESSVQFDLKEVSPEIQRKIELNDAPVILRGYTLTTEAQYAPPPKVAMIELKPKQTVIGCDIDMFKNYIENIYDLLIRNISTSDTIRFASALGNTYLQPKYSLKSYEGISSDDLVILQRKAFRHQFCSNVIEDEHVKRAESWCEENGFIRLPNNCTYELALTTVELKTGKRWYWEFGLESTQNNPDKEWWMNSSFLKLNPIDSDISPDQRQQRLGFITHLSLNPNDLTKRLEFHKVTQMNNNETEYQETIRSGIRNAFDNRDDDGHFKLHPQHGFAIDTLNYRNSNLWTHPTNELCIDIRQSKRFVNAVGREAQRMRRISLASAVLNEEGVKLTKEEFTEEVMNVAKTSQAMVNYINKAEKNN